MSAPENLHRSRLTVSLSRIEATALISTMLGREAGPSACSPEGDADALFAFLEPTSLMLGEILCQLLKVLSGC